MDSRQWDKHIVSGKNKINLGLIDAWHQRELIGMFVKRDYAIEIKQTALGVIWILVQPVVNALMNLFVFGGLAGLSTDGVPQILFYYVGSMLWLIFSGIITAEAQVFTKNVSIFGKVYFPRVTVVVADALTVMVKAGIQFVLFLIMCLYMVIISGKNFFSWRYILTLPIMVWIALIGIGMGMVISSITTKYRDLLLMLPLLLPLLMYATPVVYPLSQMPEKYRFLIEINPLSAPIESFRIVCFGAGNVPVYSYVCSVLVTIFLLTLGLYLFGKTEKNFVDVI